MITVKNLTYRYPRGTVETLHGLDFEVAEGEIFGFLGPSGAGKSTTQKILIGLLKEYGGEVGVMGREIRDWGQDLYEHVGVSFELPNHYLKLTARENLAYFRSLFSGETYEPEVLLGKVGLAEAIDKKVSDFSKGMKVRLNVARSLVHKPKVLFLDEPTSGLDPVNARKIKDLVLSLRAEGMTVFVTTHNMMVADELCDRVAFITEGRIKLIDAPATLKKRYGQRVVQVDYVNGSERLQSQEFALDGLGDNKDFIALLQKANRLETIHTQETTLENIFIEVTGQELRA
ncbi:MAG TPA: ABC transporter ATP-binding protein [Anaerolineae bacterium]|nr:ABC transporter ATP-binding protein [Anaerolineae bacterium]